MQWLGSLDTVQNALAKADWQTIPKFNLKTGVILLANNPSPLLFPALPKFHRDRLPILTVTKKISETKRIVLQLWRSDYKTKDEIPLWVGTLRIETTSHPLPLVTTFIEQAESDGILKVLAKSLAIHSHIHSHIIQAEQANNHKVLLLKN